MKISSTFFRILISYRGRFFWRVAMLWPVLLVAAMGAFAQETQNRSPAPPTAVAHDPSSTPSETQVVGNVRTTQLLRQPMPKYPRAAKTAHIEGTVVLKAIITKDDTIRDLQFVSGPPELMNASMDAVNKWRYEPTVLNGEPTEVTTTVSVVFKLH
jgi:TonB family protein